MLRAPELLRLRELQRRWLSEERAISTLLQELESDLDELQSDVAYHRRLGEEQADALARCIELSGECQALATELAHVRAALRGIAAEVGATAGWSVQANRTPA